MSSQKSEVLNVLFHFRNRLDVPSPPSPDGLPALETSSASSFLYASGRPQRQNGSRPAFPYPRSLRAISPSPNPRRYSRKIRRTTAPCSGFTRSCPSSSLSKPNSRVVFTCTIFSIVSSSQTTTALRHHCCSSPPKRQLPGGWPQYSVAPFHITRPMPPSSPHHAPSSNVHVRRASGPLHLP